MIGYKLNTLPHPDGRIVQVCDWIVDGDREIETARTQIFRKVLDASDEQVRAALIQLGWTPPQK